MATKKKNKMEVIFKMDMNYMKNKVNDIEDSVTRGILLEMLKMFAGENGEANLTFAKVHPDAIIPTKRDEDAGFDIYACVDEDVIYIKPHETVMIPTGIATCFSPDYMFWLAERGSTGTKGIAQRCGIVDSGYRNEVQAPITNLNTKPLLIVKAGVENKLTTDIVKIRTKDGIKIGKFDDSDNMLIYPMSKAITQGILLKIPRVKTNEVSYDELKVIPSSRGMGAWGSSQK